MLLAACVGKHTHTHDRLAGVMLAGGGWGIGKRKLAALLEPGFSGELDPLDLVGKRLWVSTGIETYEGKDRLKVMIDELKHAGYQREDDVPPGCVAPDDKAGYDEVPF